MKIKGSGAIILNKSGIDFDKTLGGLWYLLTEGGNRLEVRKRRLELNLKGEFGSNAIDNENSTNNDE